MSLIWLCNLSEIFIDSCGAGMVEVKSRWNIERTTAGFSVKWNFQFRALTLHKFYLSQKNSFWFILLALVSISGINLEQICSLSHPFLVFFQSCLGKNRNALLGAHPNSSLESLSPRQMCFQWSSSSLWMVLLRFFFLNWKICQNHPPYMYLILSSNPLPSNFVHILVFLDPPPPKKRNLIKFNWMVQTELKPNKRKKNKISCSPPETTKKQNKSSNQPTKKKKNL